VFDLEDLPATAQPGYLALLTEARARFAARHWQVAVSAPVEDPNWDLAAYGRAADLVIVMAYDEHWLTSRPGPIASPDWFAQALKQAAAAVPASQLFVGMAAYGYDWPAGRAATPVSAPGARARAAASGMSLLRDSPASDPHFRYLRNGVTHEVWFVDAAAGRAQAETARALGLSNLALWRLGTEDPDLWRWFGAGPR
jgi:spore germination protein YaaH